MRFMKKFIFLFCVLIVYHAQAQQPNIIPKPVEMESNDGPSFMMDQNTRIVLGSNEQKLKACSDYLNQYLKTTYGFSLPVTTKNPGSNYILINIAPAAADLRTKSYNLNVQSKMISLEGDDHENIFYGLQTLIQLLPEKKIQPFKAAIPAVAINDYPQFSYRGMHLDVGRHYFPVALIKRYIDYLALHKFNYFHWHLTEDQGWRIEIKKYPNLTKTGAWRNGTILGRYPGKGNDNIPHGGFYTQQEVKEIVKYAADRFITVIPEIEMPGHCSAAIAAYPSLSCFPEEPTKIPANMISKKSIDEQAKGRIKLVQETWGVFDDVYCAGKDSTFTFLQNVLDEVLTLFPSKYIHVGGDECPKANWKRCPLCQKRMKEEKLKDEHELQSYFIQRMEKYLNNKGRTLIGWDEILEGGLAPNAVVMSWRGEEGGIAAAREKHDVIMTPGGWCYFDHSQSQNEDSIVIGGYTPIEKVYSYKPIPDSLTTGQARYVLGAQGNVWTEYMDNRRKVEYMIFPRMAALSEVLWSPKKDWDDFEKRLLTQFRRYDLWNANYSGAYFFPTESVLPLNGEAGITWRITKRDKNQKLDFRIKAVGAEKINLPEEKTNVESGEKEYVIKHSGTYVLDITQNQKLIQSTTKSFHLNKATGKQITLVTPPSQNYPGDGAFTLVNGVWNERGLARSREFLGFNGGDCEAIIDLGSVQQIANVRAHVFEQTPSWIWRPKFFQVLISQDNSVYTEMGITDVLQFSDVSNRNAVMTVQQKSVAARYIKIKLGNYGVIPDGNPGAGSKPWLFVDEIEIN
jgi:hexosaminidase